ncbi:MAG: Arc-like DNA binding domain protein [Bacteriophage sp.]|nr:MAG: Arc-like DNA binding domain protein [Bacteriophage sp.]
MTIKHLHIIIKKNKGGLNMAELTAEEKAIKNREAVKKCMKNKDRINVILPQGTLDRINSYGLKTNAFARELILAELDKMDKMKK